MVLIFLARYQSSKLDVSIFGALSIFRQSHYRENLGQASGDFPICRQNLGRSGNCEIPDRLGFNRHVKTRLYNVICVTESQWNTYSCVSDYLICGKIVPVPSIMDSKPH